MGWGQNTPVSMCVSAHEKSNAKVRGVTTAGLGVLLAFCLPGQISKAGYTSVKTPVVADVMPAAPSAIINETKLAGAFITVETPSKDLDANPAIKSVPIQEKPVQLASLELDLPKIEKPNDFVKPRVFEPQRQNPIIPPQNLSRPRLEKKLFGTVELRFDDERKIKAWSSVYYKFLGDTQLIKSCLRNQNTCTDPAVSAWISTLKSLEHASTYDKITGVNLMANRYAYSDDRRNYGKSDYWAGPREFLSRGGDCEDYALLKFASLLALGVNEQDMRLVVGRLADGTPHAFLAAKVGSREYILDNREDQVYLTRNRSDYVPKYSMNLSYRWSHVVPRASAT